MELESTWVNALQSFFLLYKLYLLQEFFYASLPPVPLKSLIVHPLYLIFLSWMHVHVPPLHVPPTARCLPLYLPIMFAIRLTLDLPCDRIVRPR